MNNYVYIVSCLPVLSPDAPLDADKIIEDILSQCSEKDSETVAFLLDGFNGEKLTEDFYRRALSHKSPFIRGWFGYDLDVRNAKARYLNRQFGRPEEMDTVSLGEEEREFDDAPRLLEVLSTDDILGREKALDDMAWKKIDELTVFDYFDLDAILGFLAKLKITDRWLKLDPERGRELFRRISDEVRATFQGVDFEG
jgi:hypothetical protein